MKRPLKTELIEYALLDVAYLMDLEVALKKKIQEQNLEKVVNDKMKKAVALKKGEPGWMKVGLWRKFTKKQQVYLKHFFMARDQIARRFNVPSHLVMSKERLIEYVNSSPMSKEEYESEIKKENPRFRRLIFSQFSKAFVESKKEIEELNIR